MLGAVTALSPKDRFITVYGRKPVMEALDDVSLTVDKVVVADVAHGVEIKRIEQAARRRAVPVQRGLSPAGQGARRERSP
jgi:23S rRNA (guanosine2251-2'-O)-methyltransferase